MASKPTRVVRAVELPRSVFSDLDRHDEVKAALRDHEMGLFQRGALLCDQMLRDDRIAGVWSTRANAITSAPVEISPAQRKRAANKVAELIGGSDEEPGIWPEMYPPEEIGELLRWGDWIGIGLAENVWVKTAREWRPRITVWHPQFIRFDWSIRRYVLTTQDRGDLVLPDIRDQRYSDGQWIMYLPYGFMGWARARVRSLGPLYIDRQWNKSDWSRYNEKHGNPLDLVTVPENAPDGEPDAFFEDVANRKGNAAVMVTDPGGGAPKYGVQIVEATARTFDTFQLHKKEDDIDIAVCLVGQNLTTEVSDGGSRAAATIQNFVRLDVAMADARVANVLRDQSLRWYVMWNLGDPDKLTPRVSIDIGVGDDELAEAATLKAVGDAIAALPPQVDEDAILDAFGVPIDPDFEEPEEVAPPVPPAPDDGAIEGDDEPEPETQKPEEEGAPKQETARASLSIAQESDGWYAAAKGVRVGPYDDEESATRALARRLMGKHVERSSRALAAVLDVFGSRRQALASKPGARVRASRYASKVKTRAVHEAQRALRRDLRAVRDILLSATDLADARKKLAPAFARMKPEKLARITMHANVLARFGGMLDVEEGE